MAVDEHIVVGWAEYVDLPEWGIRGLRAKSDTGARSSSLHVENLRRLRGKRLAFDVIVRKSPSVKRVRIRAPMSREARVKSSNGSSEQRPFVTTSLRIGGQEREIELNLVDRGKMVHRMLLGRTALDGMVVDVSRRYVLGKENKKQHEKKKKARAAAKAKATARAKARVRARARAEAKAKEKKKSATPPKPQVATKKARTSRATAKSKTRAVKKPAKKAAKKPAKRPATARKTARNSTTSPQRKKRRTT